MKLKHIVTKPKPICYKVSTHLTILLSPELQNSTINFYELLLVRKTLRKSVTGFRKHLK